MLPGDMGSTLLTPSLPTTPAPSACALLPRRDELLRGLRKVKLTLSLFHAAGPSVRIYS